SNLTTLTLPDGRKVNHLYYGSGHLHQLNLDGQVISDMERDDLHREVFRTQGKLTSCFGYDAMGRKAWQFASTLPAEKLSQVHNPGINTSLLVEHAYNPIHRRYQYDPAGELVRTLDKLRGEIKYEYEANGQLHSRDTGSLVGSEEFRYDPAANRLDFNARQLEKVKDNRIKRWRDQEYRYDPWGNLIEKRSGHRKLQSFSYDCENRLVRAETMLNGKLESIGTYRYDSLGRRVVKQSEINGITEQKRFLWQGLRMLREETPGQSILYFYEPGSYAPLARVDQAEGDEQKVYYFHTDHIGTPLELSSSEGEIVWQATYRPWGALEQLAVKDVEQNLRFQGQYYDDETGLHYNTFRYYSPETGRFNTQDPIGLHGSVNLYFYAPNPIRWIDPLGWYNGEGVRQLGVYDIFHENTLAPSEFKLNDATHFSLANQSVYERMNVDADFKATIEAKYPGITKHVQPRIDGSFSGDSPPKLTWHHGDSPGSLQLVDRLDHKTYHKIYHPDGTGGRNKWGGGTACR
ncbi:RHS repeat-associated core domain-containing protein, partial [Pseudomonas sp. P39-UII1]|uniref:RHS repeat-associated core domain-containing protein n=1 Tax=Pseudomonas sp. P39-UII1 TaxID=3080333 RepID=UPI00320B364A